MREISRPAFPVPHSPPREVSPIPDMRALDVGQGNEVSHMNITRPLGAMAGLALLATACGSGSDLTPGDGKELRRAPFHVMCVPMLGRISTAVPPPHRLRAREDSTCV